MSMYQNCPEEPGIARAQRTGYGTIYISRAEKKCCVCHEPVYADTVFAESEDGPICHRCGDRLNELFADMSFIERAKTLGMDLIYNA